jgi:hypothetical protein
VLGAGGRGAALLGIAGRGRWPVTANTAAGDWPQLRRTVRGA